MAWLAAIAAGMLAAVPGAVCGTVLAYLLLAWAGTREHEGRRGLLAGTIGIPAGAVLGFWLGSDTALLLLGGGGGSWRPFLAGVLLAVPAATVAFVAALVLGTAWAERRGISNYAGERAAWALYRVALPAAVAIGCGAFVAGQWLVGR